MSLSHSVIVPSATLTPIWGMTISVVEELTRRLLHALDARQQGLLERWAERNRGVRRGDPRHRPVEVLEGVLGDERRHLGAGRARVVGLVDDQRLRRLAHARQDRLGVERL